MILGHLHRQRPFAGAIALVAMAFYTVLLPWHTVSQATGPPLSLGKSFETPCHQASAAGDNVKTPQPAKPRTLAANYLVFHYVFQVFMIPEVILTHTLTQPRGPEMGERGRTMNPEN